jgi:hypothetical protein
MISIKKVKSKNGQNIFLKVKNGKSIPKVEQIVKLIFRNSDKITKFKTK